MKWTMKLSGIHPMPIYNYYPSPRAHHPGVQLAREAMIETLEAILKADQILFWRQP